MVEDIEDALPSHIKLAYLPNLARVRLRLTGIGKDPQSLKEEVAFWKDKLVSRLGDLVYGYNKQTLSAVLQSLAIEKGVRIATAESCTGGRIAQEITSEPGSSQYFLGSVVAYANQVKQNILGVSQQTLANCGAVSEETVNEMVLGACKSLSADIAVATSGIAGPDGGTFEKPVGTIWIAVGNSERMISKKLQLSKNRVLNIEYTSMIALNLMRRFLMDL
jgi:nicotinamide-nucleotide amidase